MALMLGRLYDALRAGGVPDDRAREAAEEVATCEKDLADIRTDIRLLKWISGTTLAGVLAVLVKAVHRLISRVRLEQPLGLPPSLRHRRRRSR